MRVGLVFGGRSVEHSVSIRSARTVAAGLREAGHEVVALAVAQDGCWLSPSDGAALLAGEDQRIPAVGAPVAPTLAHLLESRVDAIFPIVHGTWGEDGTLQGLCEMLDLPYVGAGVTASAVAMDKVQAKAVLEAAGLPVVPYRVIRKARFQADPDACLAELEPLGSPLFVKPSVGGSSVGVVRAGGPADRRGAVEHALRFDGAALIERAVTGREIECAVLGLGELEASPLGEIVPGKEFYDYEDKYLSDGADLIAPAPVPEGTAEALRDLAVRAFEAVGGEGMARVDFFLEPDGTTWINEINTLPGFTRISMYPRLWELGGLPLGRLVGRLVELAVERHRQRRRLDDGIKSWLASLEG